jgi:hypothetical protein
MGRELWQSCRGYGKGKIAGHGLRHQIMELMGRIGYRGLAIRSH